MEGETNLAKIIEEQSFDTAIANCANSPLLSIVSASSQGLTLLSQQNFDVGCQIRMGLHVRLRKGRSPLVQNHFISVQGFVVASLARSPRGRTMFEITLLFDDMSEEDRRILSSVPQKAIQARANRGISDYEAFLLGEKTRSVVGLN